MGTAEYSVLSPIVEQLDVGFPQVQNSENERFLPLDSDNLYLLSFLIVAELGTTMMFSSTVGVKLKMTLPGNSGSTQGALRYTSTVAGRGRPAPMRWGEEQVDVASGRPQTTPLRLLHLCLASDLQQAYV